MTSPITPKKRAERAFTLVELLLVVTIIGVLAAVTVPRYSMSFEGMKLRSGAHDVAATLEFAQAMSILESRHLRFNVSDDGRACWISEERASGDRRPMIPVRCELPDGVRVDAIRYVNPLAGTAYYLDFSPSGEVEPCAVMVTSRSGDSLALHVTRGVGHVRLARSGSREADS